MLNYLKTLLNRLGLNNPTGYFAIVVVAVVALYFVLQLNVQQTGGGESNGTKMVLYYAPWCGHCQKLKPTWAKLEQQYNGKVMNNQLFTIDQVNCDEQKELASSLNINGFPTIMLYRPNGERVVYQGDRSLEDLTKFLLS